MNYEIKKALAQKHARKVRQQKALYKIRHQYDEKKEITTTKIIIIYLFIVLNAILVYSMWMMFYLQDISALPVLITDIAGQIIVSLGYMVKSMRENTKNGIIFETAMKQLENENGDEDAAG